MTTIYEEAIKISTYKLVLAEKPSVAKSLANLLGATNNKEGYMEGGGHIVSWCFGHLVELAPPAAYGEQYKRWNRNVLPILPDNWKHAASNEKKKQLDILRSLMKHADVELVINACDAGREGELIFRLVYEYCGCKKPVQRLWISSMEDTAIREGFSRLKDGADYDCLYHAAVCRAQADWLVGMNATRLFSCLYGATLSVGRVQSPTLAMIVEREAAVQAFVAKPFYTPTISTGSFFASGERLDTPEEAEKVRAACDGMNATVLSAEKKEKTESPPKLYDLTTLQREANRLLGYTAKQTLDLAQSLYEKKLITYPRTDSRYITGDMAGGFDEYVNLAAICLPFISIPVPVNTAAVINDGLVSDHHAILPTKSVETRDLQTLPSGEKNILSMVITRMVCAVGESHRFEAASVTMECSGYTFTAKGKTVLQDGWKTVNTAFRTSLKEKYKDEDDNDDDGALPSLSDGQTFFSVAASVKEGKTSPPKRYTEDTLLAAMEVAGSEETPDDAERKGLGTPATRAGVIEKLIKSGVVERKKKNLTPTDKGKNLISVLPENVKSAALTAEWEQQLKQVERGQLADTEFMGGITALTQGLVAAHAVPVPEYESLFAPAPKGAVVGKCPRCGADVIEAPKGFFCSSRACRFVLWKDSRFWSAKDKKLDKKIVSALLTGERVLFSDLISQKTGKPYTAAILLEDDGTKATYKLEFEKVRKAA